MAAGLLLSLSLGRVRPVELDAVWWLYENLNGPNWTLSTNWNRSLDPCRRHSSRVPHRLHEAASTPFTDEVYEASAWFGVGCTDQCDDYLDGPDCTAGRIVSIQLRGNGLLGDISGWEGLRHLKHLSHLDLSYNRIGGSLPEAHVSHKSHTSLTLPACFWFRLKHLSHVDLVIQSDWRLAPRGTSHTSLTQVSHKSHTARVFSHMSRPHFCRQRRFCVFEGIRHDPQSRAPQPPPESAGGADTIVDWEPLRRRRGQQ